MSLINFVDVLRARETIAPYVNKTPTYPYIGLSKLVGAEIYLKHENHHALGSFKVRGGINYMSNLAAESKKRGVITASTGNHGQSIAYSASVFGVPAVIVSPEDANTSKVESMRNLGAELILKGKNFDEARETVETEASQRGLTYIHAANEPLIIAGVATYGLEMLEDIPDIEVVIAPIGGGSNAAALCTVAKVINPKIQIIGVQSAQAPAAYQSWTSKGIKSAPTSTVAEGLATSIGFELTQNILWELLDDSVLVDDKEIEDSIVTLATKAHTLAEEAGASTLACALKIKDRLSGKKVALVISGGNISLKRLKAIMSTA